MKKLLKKIVLLIGTVCLCFLGVSFYGPSREAQAASYSVSTYAQLVEACGKSGPNTVTIAADITLSGTVTIGRGCNITLNGNGKVIRPSNAANCFEILSGGKLTVSNLTVDRSNSPNGNVFFVGDGGALVVNGGTYKAGNGSAGVGSSVINAKGMATINGGTFSGSNQDFYAVTLSGAYPYVINNGTFTNSTSGVGVNLDTAGTQSLTINNGNFHNNANNGITVGNPTLSQAGTTTVTINNGNFYNNGANGISVCYKNQTCNIKRGNFYNNAVGILCHEAKVSFTGTASDAAYLKVYNNKSHNVSVQQAGTFTGGNANMTNTGACVGKGSGIRVNNGTVTINSGLTINNCENGIVSYSSTDKVTVNGGLISGCATGINMDSSGTCTINNVNVTGNKVGIDADYRSTVKMIKGTITNNTTGIWCESSSNTTLAGSSAGAIVIAGNSENGIKTAHSAILNASNISVYSGGGYNAQPVGLRLNSSKDASISGNIYSHTDRGIISNTTGTVTVGGTINNNYVGVEVLKGTLNSTATMHTNTYGLYVPAGTANVSSGNYYSNTEAGIYVNGGTANVTGGSVYSNKNGLRVASGVLTSKANLYSNTISGAYVTGGTCSLTGGNIYGNATGVECAGGSVTTSTAIYNNTSKGIYAYNSGVCSVAGGNIYGNDTALWVKGTATISVSRANIYNNGYGLYAEGSGVLNVNGSSSGAINIMGNDDVGIHVRDTATASVSNANIYSGNGYNTQKVGVVVLTSKSVSLGSNTNIYSHAENGVTCKGGTTTSVASVYSNGTYGVIVNGATFTMSGGKITSNKNYGLYLAGSSKATVSGGNIESNAGAYGDVFDEITDFTLTGTYSGRSSVNGYVYLAKNDNYVKTANSNTLIKVRPSTYYSGRVVINTSSASYAATQERSTLYPNSGWILKKSGVNVVLARIPSIWYDGEEITDTLYLPSADGWYNAKTIGSIKEFTAKDEDNDLVSFIMKYDGQTVVSGTKDTSGVMHIDYDFMFEGIREYEFTATDSLGNSVTRTVIIKADLTPPSIIDVPDSEPDDGSDEPDDGSDEPDDGSDEEPGGEGATYTWTVVIVEPDATIEQQGEDMLSGVAHISVSKFSEQDVFINKIYNAPYKIKVSLADYPEEKGVVIKVVDKAGNEAYKCVLDKSKLEIKIEPFFPR